MPARLQRHEPSGTGLERCLREELAGVSHALRRAPQPLPVATVHRVRRRLKRCRAALRLLRGVLGATRHRRCDHLLRDAARLLSAPRDAAAARAALATLARSAKVRSKKPPQAMLGTSRKAIEPEHARRDVDRVQHLLRTMLAKLREADLSGYDRSELRMAIQQLEARARRARRRWRRKRSIAAMHTWRKRAKTWQHALDLARTPLGRSTLSQIQALRTLGSALGKRLDLEVLARTPNALFRDWPKALRQAFKHRRRRLDLSIRTAARAVFS